MFSLNLLTWWHIHSHIYTNVLRELQHTLRIRIYTSNHSYALYYMLSVWESSLSPFEVETQCDKCVIIYKHTDKHTVLIYLLNVAHKKKLATMRCACKHLSGCEEQCEKENLMMLLCNTSTYYTFFHCPWENGNRRISGRFHLNMVKQIERKWAFYNLMRIIFWWTMMAKLSWMRHWVHIIENGTSGCSFGKHI